MDLADRIQRRRNGRIDDSLVVDWDALNPAYHLDEPVGRAAVLEEVLDTIDPIFDDQLPPSVYLWGPAGSGKSAILTALINAVRSELANPGVMYTSTRGRSAMSGIRYVYVDSRRATSKYKLYRHFLEGLTDTSVPPRGIGTDALMEEIQGNLSECAGALLAVDHVATNTQFELASVMEQLKPFKDVAILAAGRTPPEELPMPVPSEQIHVPAYTGELFEVLSMRATRGLSRAWETAHARNISDWADGNAHDALTALYTSAIIAEESGASSITETHIDEAISEIPPGGTAISHLLALTDSQLTVLYDLLAEKTDEEVDIDAMAERIGKRSDLSSNTVKRILYELSQAGVLERVELKVGKELVGRRPSMVRPNFATRAFRDAAER